MTRFLALAEVLDLHRRVIAQSGGATGLRDLGMLEAAIAQPRQTYAGTDLYPSLAAKSAALGFSLIQNHPFVDGNKRVGHAALEVMLLLNGAEFVATVDEAEHIILGVASGTADRRVFTAWVESHMRPAR
ncbi:MAG: type II toxin-antitoxin system death-on-curing family toxin [Gemmatimonadales bacterium]|nr:type II toxin-antitoxin system death-on-curing family toxin [Gemmatimonadales bacterium]MBP7620733.1 type II toxin-antitoxin system death-on-curing family toxin [Gemmatimonadales bacterium]